MSASSRCKESLTVSRRLFTSESVTEGHPDKMADQISDTILDAMLTTDPASRVAVETMITTGQVHIAGEVTTQTYVDIPPSFEKRFSRSGMTPLQRGSTVTLAGSTFPSMPSPPTSLREWTPPTRRVWTTKRTSSIVREQATRA